MCVGRRLAVLRARDFHVASRRTPAGVFPHLLRALLVYGLVLGAACATPMTQVGSVTREQIEAEQVKQQQLTIRSALAEQQRVEDVAAPLLAAALPLCPDAVTTR